MGSIQVSFDFEEWKRIDRNFWDSDLTGYRPGLGFNEKFYWKGHMITFEQVAKIEALRRQIETLQSDLSHRANQSRFRYQAKNDIWCPVDGEANAILRECYCKFTVAKIIKLLDESERLGVDVSKPKETLLEFLEEIKPKENTDELC